MTAAERNELNRLDRKWSLGKATVKEIMRCRSLMRQEDAEWKKVK